MEEQNTNYTQPGQPAQPVSPAEKPKKTIPLFSGIAIIVVVAVVIFGGVFAYQYFFVKPQAVVQPQNHNFATAGWKTYRGIYTYPNGSSANFVIDYPSSWVYQKFICNKSGVAFCPATFSNQKDCGPKYTSCSLETGDVAPIVLDLTTFMLDISHLTWNLLLFNNKYNSIYNQMLSTFKFTK